MKIPFIEVISWIEHRPDLMMWKFPDEDAEIKNGAKLTVRESEKALLLNEGKLADVFEPGLHTLTSANVPVLSRLKGWKYGFESPFKADVYFFSTKQFVALKWGTAAPVIMRDTQFGQVRIRAFGTYNIRIKDVATFFKEYAGTYPVLSVGELQIALRDYISPRFGQALAQSGIPVLDIAGNLESVNLKIRPLIAPYFEALGVEVTEFTVSSVNLPEEVLQYFDKVTGMNMVTDMDKYARFNTANAIGQPGTAINDGAQQGAAMGMLLQQVAQTQAAGSSAPTPVAPADDIAGKLTRLKQLFDSQLIDEAEYKAKKAELLQNL
ncbi:membrane protease subunit (stomatin/prohibitin family) [Filimonas zeae]|uniref:Antifreeze protein, type I n=1 Tax=Filimonas zeae TaxID=1737353 RepID=A0A917MX53_9BACT|nr:SPFH domain-containing protein [Filimonas zeae]MDR6340194.1 membrane protease subunit (stomatin/prohibitin family) [Filimonas zeae]GGH71595.1 antifreeze protein, type I [Filimonas zeae]